MNIKQETPDQVDDLAVFTAGSETHRLDDKAAVLEDELMAQKAQFNKERFLYYFVIILLISTIADFAKDGLST